MEKSKLLETFLPEGIYFAFYSELAAQKIGYCIYKNKKTNSEIRLTALDRDINAEDYLWSDKELVGEIDINFWSITYRYDAPGLKIY